MTTPARDSMMAARAWLSDWQHVILACVCLICGTVAAIFVPGERWEKLGHYLADPATLVTFTAIGGVFVALYRRARGLPPAVVLLALCLAPAVSGCSSADFAKALDVARPIVKWTCGLSSTLCEKGDGAEACAAVAAFCGIVPPVLDAIPTSGGESSASEPHTIDGEDDAPCDLDNETRETWHAAAAAVLAP